MKFDLLVAEIGSTTTLVNVFDFNKGFIGQGMHPTTIEDVTIGLNGAIKDYQDKTNDSLEYSEMLATSSAAGGLRMTVHGLVYDMTVKAAKEAALGAGANIHLITAGRLTEFDLKKIKDINPNIVLLAGGVDFGETETAIHNAYKLKEIDVKPVIYAGNKQIQDEIESILDVTITENVYPKIDELNVEPTRKIIHSVFEDNIIHAKGMSNIDKMVESIIPTPGAVMQAAKLIANEMGDCLVIDVGGATTDIHSVTSYVKENQVSPEPDAKRTVEGDLGVYVNKDNLVELTDLTGFDKESLLKDYQPIPRTDEEVRFVEKLTYTAVKESLNRHAGEYKEYYTANGVKKLIEGKDLTEVKNIILTGGALTNLNGVDILRKVLSENVKKLLPVEAKVYIDSQYILASIGAISRKYPDFASILLKGSLKDVS